MTTLVPTGTITYMMPREWIRNQPAEGVKADSLPGRFLRLMNTEVAEVVKKSRKHEAEEQARFIAFVISDWISGEAGLHMTKGEIEELEQAAQRLFRISKGYWLPVH